MRKLTDIAKQDETIPFYLSVLADKTTQPEVYRDTFYALGEKLALQINKHIDSKVKVLLACTNEDADWLSKGIFDHLLSDYKNIAVFWNVRTAPSENYNLMIAPITKQYVEMQHDCDTLIICKSIIFTSCVVRTNLNHLINQIDPRRIIIAAPVIFKSAERTLRCEFDESISKKFDFLYFAEDDQEVDGEVIPGIGGDIYSRLGFNKDEKNKFTPEIVKSRRAVL